MEAEESSRDQEVPESCSGTSARTATMSSNQPHMWSIPYTLLMEIEETAAQRFGTEAYSRMTMRDINREIIEPCCRQSGKSYALSANPNGLKVDAFITHSWDGIFQDFVQAIRTAFQTSLTKPNLWICAFALIQGDHQLIEQQVGGKDSSLDASPFVNALEHASQFVVVRNSKTDLYSRIWCVCELIFAKAFGLVPHKTHVTGPDQFSQLKTSCLDAQSTEPKDKYRILKFLLNEHSYEDIDEMVQLFRTQVTPTLGVARETPIHPIPQQRPLEFPATSSTTIIAPQQLTAEQSLLRLRSILHPFCDEDEQLIRERLKHFAGGTREWIIRGFDDWLNGSDHHTRTEDKRSCSTTNATSRVFVLTGVAGVGKTGIMCKLARARSGRIVASHFCRHDDNRRNNPKRMLLSLAYQLAQKLPQYREMLDAMIDEGTLKEEAIDKANLTSLFNEFLKVPLLKLKMDGSEKYVMLIDALDECDKKGKNDILLCIQRHFLALPSWLYVYVTSRPEVPVMDKLKRFNPKNIEPTEEENRRDLTIFYEQVLEQAIEKLASNFIKSKAVETLVNKSGGLFIYASFLADAIRCSDKITPELVDQFPDNLDGYYEEQFDRICGSDSECLEWEITKLVVSASEPLHVEVIQAFLKCGRKDLLNPVKNLSKFFQVDENWKLHIYHKSLVEFLTSDDRRYSDLYVDMEEQHQMLATVCHQLVQDFGLSTPEGVAATSYHPEVVSYVLNHGISHLCSVSMYEEAKQLILNVGWLMARAKLGHGVEMVHDCRLMGDRDRAVELVGRAIGLSLNALRNDFRQLPAQLIGRLGGPTSYQTNRPCAIWALVKDFVYCVENFGYGFQWYCPLAAVSDQANQPCLLCLRGHRDLVNSIALSPSGVQIASASRDCSVRLCDSESGAEEQFLRHGREVLSVDYSPDGTRLVSGSADRKMTIWDSDTGAREEAIKLTGVVADVHWTRFGIISVSTNKISIWNTDTIPITMLQAINTTDAHSARISPDGTKLIVSSALDFTIRIFKVATGLCENEINGHTGRVRSLAISPNGRCFASASSDKSVRVFNLSTLECIMSLQDHHDESIFDVTFSADSKLLASASYDNTVRIFDAFSGQCLSRFKGHSNSVTCLAFSPGATRLITGSVDKSIRIWDATVSNEEDSTNVTMENSDFVTSIIWSPDGTTCYVGSRQKKIRYFNPATGECFKEVQTTGEVNKLAWSSFGVIAASKDSSLQFYDFTTGDFIKHLVGHTDSVNDVACLNETVVSGSSDSSVRVFDATTESCKMKLLGHEAAVSTVAISPDRTKVASGSRDKTVRIYSLSTGACEKVLTCESLYYGVHDALFTQDGKQVITRTARKSIYIWTIKNSNCVKLSRRRNYRYPPGGFDGFAPNLGIEENQFDYAPPEGTPVGIRCNHVVTYGKSNPCAVSRGSVVFYKLMTERNQS